MNLSGIIAISGKPGLYKVIAQGKNNIIVESLIDKKRVPAYSTDRISALDDISIYTTDEDAPLKAVLTSIYKKEEGNACLSHKEDLSKLEAYLKSILPNYDTERVYPSDVKKVFQWYNLLLSSGNLSIEEEGEVENKEDVGSGKEKTASVKKGKSSEKVAAAKKATTSKTVASGGDKAKSVKSSAPKKTAAVKTGSSRGK
jgi:hypothetical protein